MSEKTKKETPKVDETSEQAKKVKKELLSQEGVSQDSKGNIVFE